MNVTVQITNGALSSPPRAFEAAACGAVVCFEGIVRPSEDGRMITGLEYTMYDPMAEKQLRRLAEEAINRFGLLAAGVEHSRGFVPVSAISFRLQIASSHRKEAIAAMGWYIDALKKDVPIWKTAVFATGAAPGVER